jgi:hypothetical protein
LNGLEYIGLLAAELTTVTIPEGPRRRSGTDALFADCLGYVRRDLDAVREMLGEGGTPASDIFATGANLAAETASLLYAAGAPHVAWRHWSALTSLGRLLLGDRLQGCLDAVLGAEWAYIERLRGTGMPVGPNPQRVVWQLVVGSGDATASMVPRDSYDHAWLDLLASIPARDHRRTEAALRELAEFWIGEDEDWECFHPRSYPDFQSDVCAAAQAARRRGYVPEHLDEEILRYLEPGLVADKPSPLSPEITPFA